MHIRSFATPMQNKPEPELTLGPDREKVGANRWQVAPADFAQWRETASWSHVADMGVLEIEGPDALAFLHAQTTADILAMSTSRWQLGGYCTAKGRLLGIFQAWRWDGGVRLLVPANIATNLQRRLSMFVLRSKVRVHEVSPAWALLGLHCHPNMDFPARAGVPAPEEPWQCVPVEGDGRIARMPSVDDSAGNLLLAIPARALAQWKERLAPAAELGAGLWWWSQIQAGIPAVFASTQELFVPQTVNLEVLGGVSFRKGCYPGQEIVARSQYLGKLRRRLALAHAPQLGALPDIFHDGATDPVGHILMAATAPEGGWDLLLECPTELTLRGSLHAGAPDAPAVRVRPLPYPIVDPTA